MSFIVPDAGISILSSNVELMDETKRHLLSVGDQCQLIRAYEDPGAPSLIAIGPCLAIQVTWVQQGVTCVSAS